MDALKMAAVESADASHESAATFALEKREINLVPRIKRALAALVEAHEYARDLGADCWDFAIEITGFRRLKLSNSDLRWLVVRGLAEHAIEVTPLDESQRSFRRPARLMFSKRTCFVLARAGAELARTPYGNSARRTRDAGTAANSREFGVLPAYGSFAPKWDRDRQELRIGSIVVKQFKIPSRSQTSILAVFEENGWPPRIDDPLTAPGEPRLAPNLAQVIELLNENLRPPLIRFRADAAGNGMLWEARLDRPRSSEA